ncbi:helix-turn-helix transcriptional regulator [Ruegeria sp. 2205SS24-7]|uniref:helix-turn-helix domain-containing protein n=1 Tax=Ruegeria discodermiae TaxID=3064389 RepID=UPI0027419F6E|nr:helix-turn-helix transcriptional regulator [Ruegeria sp. 2205SS24-7]MDP5215996.1 helix-turn-helix transcriptional regulator [Ruegeria sp. 2205SS24-7]
MPRTKRTQTQLRMIFGDNLRLLSRAYPSISELSRQLGINRTQFNRYLSGESFPRPDVLDRICDFFGTDARILLHPVAVISRSAPLLGADFLQGFMTQDHAALDERVLPSGLYQVTRRLGDASAGFLSALILIFREVGEVFVRGYNAAEAGLPRHEFRGYAACQDAGLMLVTSQRGAQACAVTFLSPLPDADTPVWTGHAMRRPASGCPHVVPVIYEYLGRDPARILRAARQSGAITADQLSALQKAHLPEDQALT